MHHGDFPSGPVKNLLCNAGDVGLIPGQGTKIPHAVEDPMQPNRQVLFKKKKIHHETNKIYTNTN